MSTSSPSRNYFSILLLMAILCVLPVPRWLTNWMSDVVIQLLTPVSEPLARVGAALRPAPKPYDEDDPAVRAIKEELDRQQVEISRLEEENATLRSELNALRDIADPTGIARYRPLRVRKVGSLPLARGRSFQVNAGSQLGVEPGTVAVIPPTQLAGVVTDVAPLTSTVLPITSTAFDLLEVRIDVPNVEFGDDPRGTLQPDDKGGMFGLFERAMIEQLGVAPGMAVRLDDPSIGEAHTGLLVGLIDRIEPNDENPLHARVFVKPSVDIDRVQTMYLKIPRESGS